MKLIDKIQLTKRCKRAIPRGTQRIISVLVLTGILSLTTGLTLLNYATAAPQNISQSDLNRTNSLPSPVANAVRQDLARRVKIPPGQLKITNSSRKTWPDGCLGLPKPDEFCTQALVEGWRITLSNGRQTWVYRSDRQGRVLRLENQTAFKEVLDEQASQISDSSNLKPIKMPTSELPPRLKPGVVFRAITSGGFAGRIYETTLLKDGRLIQAQLKPNGTTSQSQTYRIAQQQLQQFQQVLKQQQFARFNGLEYPPPKGAADHITVTLTSPDGTSRYTDINQDLLPGSLQKVIQAWNQLVSNIQG